MKKQLSMLLIFACILLAACSREPEVKPITDPYQQGLNLISVMDELAASEDYIRMCSANDEIFAVSRRIASKPHETPSAVYAITVSPEDLAREFDLTFSQDASIAVRTALNQRITASLVSNLNSHAGASHLAAASICSSETSFVNPEFTQTQFYLYTYEEAMPVFLCFLPGQDGSVRVNGSFLVDPAFRCGSAEEIQASFGDIPLQIQLLEI